MSMRSGWLILFFKISTHCFFVYWFYKLLREESWDNQWLLWICLSFLFSLIRFVFWNCHLKVYIYKVVISSQWADVFKHPSKALLIFVSKSMLSDMNKATPNFLYYLHDLHSITFYYFSFMFPVYYLQVIFTHSLIFHSIFAF